MKGLLSVLSFIFLITVSFGQEALANTLEEKLADKVDSKNNAVSYNTVTIKKYNDNAINAIEIENSSNQSMAADFGSAWVWPEFTLEMIDSYMPFIFRTKISAELDEVRVVLNVNNKGKLVGYELLTEADKGLEERIAHVLRKFPRCTPVPGYENYDAMDFELIIKR